MNKIPNRQAICEVLMERAKTDRDIVVLCSDSRGSRACQMRKESICGVSGKLCINEKL